MTMRKRDTFFTTGHRIKYQYGFPIKNELDTSKKVVLWIMGVRGGYIGSFVIRERDIPGFIEDLKDVYNELIGDGCDG